MGCEMRNTVWRIGLFLALSLSCASTAHANDLLKAMDGPWKGNGWAKRTADGAREVVRCRLHNKYFPDNRELIVSGKCVVPGKKFDLKGSVTSQNDSNILTGRWANPFGFGSTGVEGVSKENEAILNFSAPDPETKRDVDQQMNWQVSADGFRIISRLLGAGNIELSDLQFRR